MANTETAVLANSAYSVPLGSRAVRKTDPNRWMELTLGVRRRAALPDLSAWEEIPPSQRVPMSRAELCARHGSDPAAVAAIGAWAQAFELSITRDDAVAARVGLGGTAANLAEAFGVELFDYEHDDLGEFHARVAPVCLPEALIACVTGVFGFNNHAILRTSGGLMEAAAKAGPWFTPPELARVCSSPAFNLPGRTIGLLEFGDAGQTADVTAYFSKLGLTRPTVRVVAGDRGATASAAGPRVVVYFSTFDEKGLVDVLATVIGDGLHDPSVLSLNWGEQDGAVADSSRSWSPALVEHIAESFLVAAHLGISVCADTAYGAAPVSSEAAPSLGGPGSLWDSLIDRLKSMLYLDHMIGGDAAELLAAFR